MASNRFARDMKPKKLNLVGDCGFESHQLLKLISFLKSQVKKLGPSRSVSNT